MRFCLCAVVQPVIKRPSGSGSGCPILTFYHALSGTGKGKGKYNSKVISVEETSRICHPSIMCLFCSQGFFWKGIKPNIASGAIFCIVCVFAWRIYFPTEVLKGLFGAEIVVTGYISRPRSRVFLMTSEDLRSVLHPVRLQGAQTGLKLALFLVWTFTSSVLGSLFILRLTSFSPTELTTEVHTHTHTIQTLTWKWHWIY